MAHDVFISYSSKDRVVAIAVCAALEAEKVRCWVASRDIKPGQSWAEAITGAIEKSSVMILIFSSDSNNSKDVLKELTLAIDSGVFVIPLRIEYIEPKGAMKYYLSDLHWLDAINPLTEKQIRELFERIKPIIEISSPEKPPKTPLVIKPKKKEDKKETVKPKVSRWRSLTKKQRVGIIVSPIIIAISIFLIINFMIGIRVPNVETPEKNELVNKVEEAIPKEEPEAVVEPRGNSVGNIINGGLAAQKGDWIYYQNYDDGYRIYKIKTDGSRRERINDDWSQSINVVGDWIYYQNFNDSWRIYKIRTDGSSRERINDDDSGYINVAGDWIYYVNYDDSERIYKIKTDGSSRERINDDYSRNINVVGDWIYYQNHDDGCRIYKIRTDGSSRERINDDISYFINVVGDWIYYSNWDDGCRIYKIRTDGSRREVMNWDDSGYFNVVGDWIYYQNSDDGGRIYKIKTDGSSRERINEDDSHFINVVGDWIYYQNSDDGGRIYKIRTDGSGRQTAN